MAIDEEKFKKDTDQRKEFLDLKQAKPKTEVKARLTIALRENLKKRKMQKRSRKVSVSMLNENKLIKE